MTRTLLRFLTLIAIVVPCGLSLATLLPVPRNAASNTNFPGRDLRSFDAGDPVRCNDVCNRDARCYAWTWVRPGIQGRTGKCWLKDGAPSSVADRCCISGVKPPTGRMERGINRPGSDYRNFTIPSADPKVCENACYGEAQCKAWTYVRPGVQGNEARCWLKNRVPRPVADGNCVSGGKPEE